MQQKMSETLVQGGQVINPPHFKTLGGVKPDPPGGQLLKLLGGS